MTRFIKHILAKRRLAKWCKANVALQNTPHSIAARKGWQTRKAA